LVRSIIDNQQQIVFYCQQDPTLLPFAFETEKVICCTILFIDELPSGP